MRQRLRAEAKLGSVALSPDGTEVAAGGWDGGVHRWRLAGRRRAAAAATRRRAGHRGRLSAGGSLLLAGGHEGSLRIWRSGDGTLVRQLAGPRFRR